jgi:hypothetical protein
MVRSTRGDRIIYGDFQGVVAINAVRGFCLRPSSQLILDCSLQAHSLSLRDGGLIDLPLAQHPHPHTHMHEE